LFIYKELKKVSEKFQICFYLWSMKNKEQQIKEIKEGAINSLIRISYQREVLFRSTLENITKDHTETRLQIAIYDAQIEIYKNFLINN